MTSLFDLLAPKTEHVEVHHDSDGYDTPIPPDYNKRGDPTLTENTPEPRTFDMKNIKLPFRDMIKQRLPATKDETSERQLLAQILDALTQDRQVTVPSDFTHPRSRTFDANVPGEWIIEGLSPYGYLYLPPHPITLQIWLGYGTGQPLTTVPAGESLNAQIPNVDVITLSWDAPSVPTTLYAYPSTRPFRLDSDVGSNIALSSTAAVDGDTSPAGQLIDTESGTDFFLANAPFTFNELSWDRQRGNTNRGILGSAARTVNTLSSLFTNHNAVGAIFFINVTAITLTPSITIHIACSDGVSFTRYASFTTAITAIGIYAYTLYPGAVGGVAGSFIGLPLPRSFRVEIDHLDADSITYSVTALLIV